MWLSEKLIEATNSKLLTSKTKQQAIRYLYSQVDTKGIFNDNWQKVHEIVKQIEDMGATVICTPANDGRYSNGYPINGSMSCKVYDLKISFVTLAGKVIEILGKLTCSGCGTVEFPLDKYDVVLTLG